MKPTTTARLVGALALLGGAARAQPPSDESAPPTRDDAPEMATGQRLLEEGLRHYDTADYDGAIELFRKAYEKTSAPVLLFNLGQAYRLKGDCQKASDLYRNFLRLAADSPNRDRAQRWLVALGDCAKTQLSATGAHETPPQALTVPAPPPPPAIALTAPPPDRMSRRHLVAQAGGIAVWGVAAGLGAGSIYLAVRSNSNAAQINQLFQQGGVWDARAAQLDANGRQAADTARLLLGGAIGAALLGTASYLYGKLGERHARFHP